MSTNIPIKSPCILICAIEPTSGHCYGCGRTNAEIGGWMSYSPQERDALMEVLPERVSKLEQKPRKLTRRTLQRQRLRQNQMTGEPTGEILDERKRDFLNIGTSLSAPVKGES